VKLADLARSAPSQGQSLGPVPEEHCDLCAEPIAPAHRHLLDVESRRLLCACRACTILFDHAGAGGGHYRLVPDRVRLLGGLVIDDVAWQAFGIPVQLAFFFHSSAAGRVVAFYPSPVGATESLLDLDVWNELGVELEPDVEALLVNRGECWLVGVDRCYELVGLVRTHWKGFGGGDEVWSALDDFFDKLRKEAK
jgi:hypothetical protein